MLGCILRSLKNNYECLCCYVNEFIYLLTSVTFASDIVEHALVKTTELEKQSTPTDSRTCTF
jgi:hypothetical protein